MKTMNSCQRQAILECLTRFSERLVTLAAALEAQFAPKSDTAVQ